MKTSAKIVTSLVMVAVALVGVVALTTTPVSAACQQPIACPAIAKLCPTGEIACRTSPCNCNLACAPPGSPACI